MLKIEKYDDLGQGIAKIGNKICFVKKAIPEEEVEIKILKEKKNYKEAVVTNVLKNSQERVAPVCPFYDSCGGCNFLHTTSLEEKKFKIERCIRFFGRMDHFFETNDGYRNKVVLHMKENKLGFYKDRSNEIVEITSCFLVNLKINNLIKVLRTHQSKKDCGKITIRCNSKEEIIISIEGTYQMIELLEKENQIDNLIYNSRLLKGKEYFLETIGSYQFMVHYNSFFQVNRRGLESIFEILRKSFKGKKIKKVLDLYSGTSVLGILASSFVKEVISVEVNKSATKDAKENIKLNNIQNLKVIEGKVEDYIDTFQDIDFIIVDPARRGLDRKSIEYLKKIASSYLVYIACDIHSLKRDLAFLKDNYQLEEIDIVDMFKRTHNVETIALLKKR